MAVFVDDMRADFGRMKMCHMVADTDAELMAMADHIGVARHWHQAPPRHDSHFDIALSKRALAVAAGAVEITWRQAAAMCARRRVSGDLGDPAAAGAWLVEHRAGKRALLLLAGPTLVQLQLANTLQEPTIPGTVATSLPPESIQRDLFA